MKTVETHRRSFAARHRIKLFAMGVVLVPVIVVSVHVARVLLADRTIARDYAVDLTAQIESQQPAGVDGWPAVERAIETMESVIADARAQVREAMQLDAGGAVEEPDVVFEMLHDDAARAGAERYHTPGSYEATELAMGLVRERGLFDDLDEAASADRFLPPILSSSPVLADPLGDRLAQLGASRELARLLGAELRRALESRDSDLLIATVRRLGALARANSLQGSLLAGLNAVGVENLTVNRLRQAVIEHSWDEPTLERLSLELQRLPGTAGLIRSVEAERLIGRDLLQWTFSDNGSGNGWLLGLDPFDPTAEPSPAGRLLGAVLVDRRSTSAALERSFDLLVGTLSAPVGSARRVELRQELEDFNATLESSPRWKVSAMLIGGNIGAVTAARSQEANHTGAATLIAIRRYELAHGEPPASLEELVPTYLDAVPVDPMSRDGSPLRYERPGEPGPSGMRFRLWSVGTDGIDNDGACDAEVPERGLLKGSPGLDARFDVLPQAERAE